MAHPGIGRHWRTIRIDRPAAGANWSTRPGGQRTWRVVSLVARLVTSVAAGDRRVRLQATDGENPYFVAESHLAHPASTTVDYAAHTGSAVTAVDNLVLPLPLPSAGLIVRPGALLEVVTTNLDVADQWSAIVVLAEEIPSGLAYEGDQFTTPIEIVGG